MRCNSRIYDVERGIREKQATGRTDGDPLRSLITRFELQYELTKARFTVGGLANGKRFCIEER